MKKIFCSGKYWPGAIALVLLTAGIFCFLQPNQASATISATATEGTLITNGSVYSIVRSGDTVYFGGSFTQVGPRIGSGVPINVSTGSSTSPFPIVIGTIMVAIPDGSNGWYIGGDFTKVGTTTRNRIAHILSTGAVDPAWDPNADDTVLDLALDSVNNVVYAGGDFSNIGGQTRNHIAALSATSGLATTWNPNPNLTVDVIVLDSVNNLVYAGGDFSNIGGQTRNKIAAINANSTGTVTTWNPNGDNTVYDIALDSINNLVYVGGYFFHIGGQTRNKIAALSATSGLATTWNPNGGTGSGVAVYALALNSSGTIIYAGGSFGSIGGQTRDSLAALNTATGTATTWNPNANDTVFDLVLDSSNNIVYVGGNFTSIGGQSRNKLAALNTATGTATAWDPNAGGLVRTLALNSGNTLVYAGGEFTTIGGQTRNNIAAISAIDGTLTSWNPNAGGLVRTLTVDSSGTIIYAGGDFTTIGGQSRNYIAALNASDGTATAWNPNAGGLVRTLVIDSSGTIIYAGGGFTTIGGQTRNRIAALNVSTGTATAWNPNANNSVYAIALDSNNNLVYAGGGFTTIGGQTRSSFAALNVSTGTATAWNPSFTGWVYDFALDPINNLIYLGGDFVSISGKARIGIAAFNIATATTTDWNPSANNSVYDIALDSNNNLVYAGGGFTTIGGQTRNYIAALNVSTGTAAVWNPNAGGLVRTLALEPNDTSLYVGGDFDTIGDSLISSFAEFDSHDITVSPTSSLVTTEAGGTATLTVSLDSRPTANVTIGISSSDTTEGTVSASSITFTPSNWNIPQTVTVTGADDYLIDGSVAYSIVLATTTSTDLDYNGVNPSDVSVSNTDNDTAGFTISTISGNTTEAGGTATFTIKLTSQPTADVTIGVSSSDTTEGTVASTSLTFTTSSWDTAQTVTVTGVNDAVVDGNIAYTIVLGAASSTDSNYNGLNPSDVSVTNNDNDTAGGGTTGGVLLNYLTATSTTTTVPVTYDYPVSPDHNLIKVDGSSAVYWLSPDNKLYLFANRETFSSWFGDDFSGLRTVSQSEFDGIAFGGNLTVKPGDYLKFDNSDVVYYVRDNNNIYPTTATPARVYLVQAGFESNYNVNGVSSDTSSIYNLIDHNLIKVAGQSGVYWLSPENKRYLFVNRETFSSWFGDDFSGLRVISQSEFDGIHSGGNITVKPGSYLKFDNSANVYSVTGTNNICKTTATPATIYHVQAGFETDYNITGNCQ